MSRGSVGVRFLFLVAAVSAVASSGPAARPISLADARPILAALGDRVPAALRDRAGVNDVTWAAWVEERAAEIRGRIAKGDEDSVVNLMLYGTGFTRWPRATPDAVASSGHGQLDRVMEGRVADLVTAIESPDGDERLQFVRQVIERHGVHVAARSRETTRRYLTEWRSRMLSENARYVQRRAAAQAADAAEQRMAHATLYRDRGLSSDTSLRVNFALEQALAAVRDRGEITRRPVGRVAVIGPGLDFVDKAQGYDFFPVQVIQPFALGDSLRRLGVADRPMVTAFDISSRVIAHLRDARQGAMRGETYRLNLLLEQDRAGVQLEPALVDYWRRFGDRVGTGGPGAVPAAYGGEVRARTVDVRPEAVLDVSAAELNIVLERVSNADVTSQFDLVVATNVLVYYDPFEQALAVSNMASLLRRGGLLMTNQPVPVPAVCGLSPVLIMSVAFGRVEADTGARERGDAVYVYRKG